MQTNYFKTAALPLLTTTLMLTACSQDSSFVEKESYDTQKADTLSGLQSSDATAKRAPNGEDSTAGDREPTEERTRTRSDDSSTQTTGSNHLGSDSAENDQNSGGTSNGGGGGGSGGSSGSEGLVDVSKFITREMTFTTHTLGTASVTQNLASAYLTSDIPLVRNYPNQVKQMTQITRQQIIDNFEQGNSGTQESQTFEQVANRPLDIVVVIDNSGSMAEEQNNMASKLSPLLSYVQDADWQIGVVTTNPDEGCLRRLIKKSDANPSQLFAQAVTAGTSGSGNERGILQAVRAMAGTCLSQPWLRTDSTVATLIVSDEDNCSSNGSDCPGKDYASGNYLYDYLTSIREPGKNARVYGLIWHPSQSRSECSTAYNKAVIYADVIARTSGTWGSICSNDYTATLSQISQDIMVVLNSKFTLSYVPDPASVRVYVNSRETTSGITITGKVVELSPPPPAGATVKITYKHDPTPIKSSFSLRYKPVRSSVVVTVNDQTLESSAYQINESAASIAFTLPPAEFAKIAVRYTRADQTLPQQFDLVDTIRPNSLSIKVNGAPVSAFTLNKSVVTFSTPPTDGASLTFTYQSLGSPVLSYPFNPGNNTARNLSAYNVNTGANIPVTYASGYVSISSSSFVEGHIMRLRYDNPARDGFVIQLPHVPLVGITAIGGQQTCSGSYLAVVDRTVSIAACGFADNVTDVSVHYSYIVEVQKEFIFAMDQLPKSDEFQQWTVWVNNQVRTDFIRNNNKISFQTELPFNATLKIQLVQEVTKI